MPFRFYAHLSWTTWARLPLIDETVANFLGPFLLAEAKRHGARVVEIGIVRDHVHLLRELPPTYDAPRLVQGLKGASAIRLSFGGDPTTAKRHGVRARSGAKARPAKTIQTAEPFRARVVAEPAPFAALRAGFQRTGNQQPPSPVPVDFHDPFSEPS